MLKLLSSTIIASAFLASASAHACERPSKPVLADGATAPMEKLQMSQGEVKSFVEAGNCSAIRFDVDFCCVETDHEEIDHPG